MIKYLVSFVRRKILRIDKYRWDYQYSDGRYDWVKKQEMHRLFASKDLLSKHFRSGKILEVGCGEGLFFQIINDLNYEFYEGFDISEIAINKIATNEKSYLTVADMEKYIPVNKPFTAIIINEVLNYSRNPVALLKRYSQFLSGDGFFLIGMFDTKVSSEIWPHIDKIFFELESIPLHEGFKTWTYKILKPMNSKTDPCDQN